MRQVGKEERKEDYLTLMDLELGAPLVAEDGRADGAVLLLDVGVVDLGLEEDLGGLEGVLVGDAELELEDTWVNVRAVRRRGGEEKERREKDVPFS